MVPSVDLDPAAPGMKDRGNQKKLKRLQPSIHLHLFEPQSLRNNQKCNRVEPLAKVLGRSTFPPTRLPTFLALFPFPFSPFSMQDNLHVALKQIGPLHYDTVLAGDQVTMYCGQVWFTITAKVASHEGLGNQCNALDRFVPIAVVAGLSISGAALLYPVAVAAMSGGAAAAGAGVLGGGAVLAQNLKEVKGWWDIGSSALSEHVSEPFKNEYAIGRYLTRLSERDVIR